MRVSATAGILGPGGTPAGPYQWQFTIGTSGFERCAGGFTPIHAGLPGVNQGTVDWGDYDGDGNLDILLTGMTAAAVPVSQIWHNQGNGTFADQTPAGVTGVYRSAAAWGDYDNDGDLDFVLSGFDTNDDRVAKIWRNDGAGAFSDQTPPGLTAVTDGALALGGLRQRWRPGPSAGGL